MILFFQAPFKLVTRLYFGICLRNPIIALFIVIPLLITMFLFYMLGPGYIIYVLRLLTKKNTNYWGTVFDLLEFYRTKGQDNTFDVFVDKVRKEDIDWEDVRIALLRLKLKDPPVKIICPTMSPQLSE